MLGGLCVISGPIIAATNDPGAPPWFVFVLLGMFPLGVGIARFIAGIQNYKWRGRTFGIVTHCLGFITLCTVYCAPTAIALAVYGFIVYLDKDVAAEFQKRGISKR